MSANPISQQPQECLAAPHAFTEAHFPQFSSGACVSGYGFRGVMNMNLHGKMTEYTKRKCF